MLFFFMGGGGGRGEGESAPFYVELIMLTRVVFHCLEKVFLINVKFCLWWNVKLYLFLYIFALKTPFWKQIRHYI